MPATTVEIICAGCNNHVGAEVVSARHAPSPYHGGRVVKVLWLVCPTCDDGSVMTIDGGVFPAAPAASPVRNLPEDVERAWREARTSHAVTAYTASEMMCRKILMYVAVDVADAPPNETFAFYVKQLDVDGHITKRMRPRVDHVRERGNEASHEITPSSEADSEETLGLVQHLLEGLYGLLSQGSAES